MLTNFLGASGEFVYDPAKGRFHGYLKTCTVRAAIRRAGKNIRFRGIRLDEISQAELAVEPIWDDVWEQQLVTEALRLVRDACQNSTMFRAFEQYVLLDRSAEIVAKELGASVNNVHQAKAASPNNSATPSNICVRWKQTDMPPDRTQRRHSIGCFGRAGIVGLAMSVTNQGTLSGSRKCVPSAIRKDGQQPG